MKWGMVNFLSIFWKTDAANYIITITGIAGVPQSTRLLSTYRCGEAGGRQSRLWVTRSQVLRSRHVDPDV